jgi:NDP-sugar pyrophosphorylase family protein
MNVRQMVFLVGGRGRRLQEITVETPKPLLQIAGRPFLDHLLDNARRFGFDRFVLIAGHQGSKVAAHYRGSADVQVVIEPEPAGTAGALVHAAGLLGVTFVLSNGDSFFDFNLLDLTTAELPAGWIGRVALRHIDDGERYGSVTLDGPAIVGFGEKGKKGAAIINGGVYWLRREVLSWIDALPCSLEQEVFPALAADRRLHGHIYDGNFIDIGIPSSLAAARENFDTFLTRAAVFLPRAWALNEHRAITESAARAIKLANDRNHFVFLVGADGDIGEINEVLTLSGAHLDGIVSSPDACTAPIRRENSVIVGDDRVNWGRGIALAEDVPAKLAAMLKPNVSAP